MSQQSNDTASIADKIAACCLLQYSEIPPKGAKPAVRNNGRFEWTILAGVVLQVEQEQHCISLCTGVKTLPFDVLSPRGDLLHDSHAEVLARRGARNWLIKRLTSEIETADEVSQINGLSRIFTQSTSSSSSSRWCLRSAASLHLYCSKLPCGDASSASILQEQTTEYINRHTVLTKGTLRGRSALSDPRLQLRTKPGKVQSMPSISMSCTDKLAMWSIVGMQGSILSRWLEPTYFNSLVVGPDSRRGATKKAEEEIEECKGILKEKAGSKGRPFEVLATNLSFIHSKEKVQEKLLRLNPDARMYGPPEDLDIVPALGSVTWIRDSKLENIIAGKRQGAALPRNKDMPLAPHTRSMLSKIAYFNLALDADTFLTPQSTISRNQTYYQAKHDYSNEYIAHYRRLKYQLRGSVDLEEQKYLVQSFLDSASGKQRATETRHHHHSNLNSSPFHGWLVSGRPFESFDCHGIHYPIAATLEEDSKKLLGGLIKRNPDMQLLRGKGETDSMGCSVLSDGS